MRWPRPTCSRTWKRNGASRAPCPPTGPSSSSGSGTSSGDWRVCLLSPFGARVHAPWALAIEARLRERLGVEVQPIWSDDGIVVRLPSAEEGIGWSADDETLDRVASGRDATAAAEAAVLIASDEVEELVVGAVGSSALFASRFRENAARALLLPRRRPGSRTPLWQMRQRSSQLLAVASRYGSFPIILETYRECLQDVFDLPALRELLAAIERREVRVVSVETPRASPFASSLLFDYIAAYMYEGDAPLVDRRAQALALDRDLLRELLGAEELRELLDADALAELELELQALTLERAAGSADQVQDLLRGLGDLSTAEVADRVRGTDAATRARAAGEWLGALAADRRAVEVRITGESRWIATEDVGRYRDGVGRRAAARCPGGVPGGHPGRARRAAVAVRASAWSVPARRPGDALGSAGRRRGDGPGAPDVGRGAGAWRVPARWRRAGVVRPGGPPDASTTVARTGSDARWSRSSHGRSDASCRRGRASGSSLGGADRLLEVVSQLEGLALPASVLERDILPARVGRYNARMLDELLAAGEVAWVGAGSLGRDDGRVSLWRAERLALLGAVRRDPRPRRRTAVSGCRRSSSGS